MRAIAIENPGPESRLIISEQEIPVCGKEQLLVHVKATAINRADLMQRQGKYPSPPGESTIPGLEVAGEVVAIGEHVNAFKVGDRVYGLVGSGGYADYCCVHQKLAAPIPSNWDYGYAVAIPEALMTAHATVFLLGKLKKNENFLIHAAGSGISCFAIQMAKYKGARVVTTASSDEKIKKAKNLGATRVINYKTEDFAALVEEQSIDLIVDFVGGPYFPKHLKLLKQKGRLVQIAGMLGHQVECDLIPIMRKRLRINGFVLRPQSIPEKAALWKSAHKQWATPLLNKEIQPIIDSEFKFTDIEQAHAHMKSSAHFGKIVIRID
ncbi:MAG: NAD(P)H-quinone oxidoreductase [Tatlockia sp.]|nr:NAD(P)H-quinone oxidoreductase [Tatlockia sp.]